MKFYYGKWWFGFEWNKHEKYDFYRSYLYPFNYLKKEHRYWGYMQDWYDGPLFSFGVWFFNITWSFE